MDCFNHDVKYVAGHEQKQRKLTPIHNSYKKEDIAKIENLLLPNN